MISKFLTVISKFQYISWYIDPTRKAISRNWLLGGLVRSKKKGRRRKRRREKKKKREKKKEKRKKKKNREVGNGIGTIYLISLIYLKNITEY